MNGLPNSARELAGRLCAVIDRGVEAALSDAEFSRLALAVFGFQYAACPVYRAYCDARGATPAAVAEWTAIPAVPTSAFRDCVMASFPVAEAVAEFHTSGTTGPAVGRHYLPTLELYHAALRPNFAAHVLPDGARLALLVLAPSPAAAPHSSLAHMLGEVVAAWGTVDSAFYVSGQRLEVERLVRDLCAAQWDGEPVALLGTTFALVHLLDHCAAEGLRFELAPGSRIMDTGGYKGRSRAVPRAELYGLLTKRLGVPRTHLVNEYGMTELGSQFYDASLRRGAPTEVKTVPPWTRVQVIDPRTGAEAAPGTRGLLRIFDLANLGSVLAVQTEDIGRRADGGFVVEGRSAGAVVRGCSLAAETLRR